jgi:hypothetical protein
VIVMRIGLGDYVVTVRGRLGDGVIAMAGRLSHHVIAMASVGMGAGTPTVPGCERTTCAPDKLICQVGRAASPVTERPAGRD